VRYVPYIISPAFRHNPTNIVVTSTNKDGDNKTWRAISHVMYVGHEKSSVMASLIFAAIVVVSGSHVHTQILSIASPIERSKCLVNVWDRHVRHAILGKQDAMGRSPVVIDASV
jgi:hypothetical protein